MPEPWDLFFGRDTESADTGDKPQAAGIMDLAYLALSLFSFTSQNGA